MSTWIDSIKRDITVTQVAGWAGMTQRLRSLGPCPACAATRRSRTDDRAPVGLTSDMKGWQCHACGTKGDAVELACYAVLGHTGAQADADGWARVREWFAARGVDTSSAGSPAKGERRAPVRSVGSMVQGILGGNAPRPASNVAPRPASQGGPAGAAGPRVGGTPPGGTSAPQGRPTGGLFGWEDDLTERCERALWQDTPEAALARSYLMEVRKLSEGALRAFRVGLYVDRNGRPHKPNGRPMVVIPLIDHHEEPVSAKFRSVPDPATCECRSREGCRSCKAYRNCQDRPLPLYGCHLLSNDLDLPVVLVEGELDVLAAYTYGLQVNVVSTTAGAGTFRDEWLDQIEPYSFVIGAYDADEQGDAGFAKVAEKLGTYRCSRARLPLKDLGECLAKGVPQERIQRVIDRAEPMHGIAMRQADEYADALETLINDPGRLRGVSTGSANLDRVIGGWRPGVIVITGETGKGKTTFSTWACLELARQGAGVMITSFEQEPIGTVQKLLRNQIGGDFTRVKPETRREALKDLAALPLWILDHYGHLTPSKLVETIRYAKRRHGVTFFLVDHLGFLIDPEAPDERRAIEAIVRALAIVAKQMGITIFLIAHPHNTGRDHKGRPVEITSRDLKGASAIRQDADDILIIHQILPTKEDPWPRTKVVADKVRSDFGVSGGSAILYFDPGSTVYADSWDDTPAGQEGKFVVPRHSPNTHRPEPAKS